MTCSGNDRVAEEVESALLVLLPTSMFDDEGDSSLVRWGGLRRNPIPGGTFHWEDYAANKTGNWIRSLRVRNLLKTTLGGSFVPSAATARATEKLRFSGTYDLRGTERLPLNSRVRIEARVRRAWSQGNELLFALLPCAWLALAQYLSPFAWKMQQIMPVLKYETLKL